MLVHQIVNTNPAAAHGGKAHPDGAGLFQGEHCVELNHGRRFDQGIG